MDTPSAEAEKHSQQQRMTAASAYSARMQEAMRYNRLSSADYPLVMAILHAISQGETEEQWKEQQQRRKVLRPPSAERDLLSIPADDEHKQLVQRLKDLMLWPW
jgi:hypothetical protein